MSPRSEKQLRRALFGLLLLPLLPLAWWLWGPRGVSVEVRAKTWRYEILVEKLVLETGSGWCDELPEGAREVSRRMLADPSGARAGLSEHCRYSVPQWHKFWMAQAQGQDPTPARWPQPELASLAADQIGAERLGKRDARYLLSLVTSGGQDWTCQLPLAQWQRFRQGERFRLRIDRHGVADCASVPVRS